MTISRVSPGPRTYVSGAPGCWARAGRMASPGTRMVTTHARTSSFVPIVFFISCSSSRTQARTPPGARLRRYEQKPLPTKPWGNRIQVVVFNLATASGRVQVVLIDVHRRRLPHQLEQDPDTAGTRQRSIKPRF